MSCYYKYRFDNPIKMVQALKEHTEKYRFSLNYYGNNTYYSQRTKKCFYLYRSFSYSIFGDEVSVWKIPDFESWNNTVDEAWAKARKSSRNSNIVFIKELINCKILKLQIWW